MTELIRQGDILLVPIDISRIEQLVTPSKNYVKRKRGEGIIVAEGEATGHHHRIRTKGVRMYRRGTVLYLTVPKSGAELTHEEHETLKVPAGVYRVDHQREYAAQAAPTRVYD